jgi:hypothetical protein
MGFILFGFLSTGKASFGWHFEIMESVTTTLSSCFGLGVIFKIDR